MHDDQVDPIKAVTQVRKNGFIEVDQYTGDILYDTDVDEYIKPIYRKYNLDDARTILNCISKGKTIRCTEERLRLPPNTICMWMRQHPDFYQNYLKARSQRSFAFEDRMIELAESKTIDKENVSVYKFKFDSYSKLASFGNSEHFSSSTTKHNHEGNVNILVDTGIKRMDDEKQEREKERRPDQGFDEIEVRAKEIDKQDRSITDSSSEHGES